MLTRMNDRQVIDIISAAAGITAVIVLFWWLIHDPSAGLTEHAPGLDNRPASATGEAGIVAIGTYFMAFDGIPSKLTGSWPRFRGKDFDNISKDNIRLADRFQPEGPAVLWSVDLGEGHAGPVVSDGKVFVLDYDDSLNADILRCFSLDDGREIWQRGYEIYIKRNHGISRTVPAVWKNYVVTIGPKCQVMCVNSDSGQFVWGLDLAKEYKSEIPLWYTGQCPLIEDSLAVLAVGGSSLIIAVNCVTGKVAWQVPNPDKWQMSHSSVIPMILHGKRMYVYAAIGGLIAISADKKDKGKVMFRSAEWNHSVIAPSPVYAGNDRIFVTAGYGAGSMIFRVVAQADSFVLSAIQQIKPDQGLASEQQTPIFHLGQLYSILPKDAGPARNQFVSCNPDDISKIIFTSGKTKRFGLGPYIIADNKFYILSDEGVLTVIKVSKDDYQELAEFKILRGHDAWGPMAIVNGRLLARDSRQMICIDLRTRS